MSYHAHVIDRQNAGHRQQEKPSSRPTTAGEAHFTVAKGKKKQPKNLNVQDAVNLAKTLARGGFIFILRARAGLVKLTTPTTRDISRGRFKIPAPYSFLESIR